jgi:hypothetical protein
VEYQEYDRRIKELLVDSLALLARATSDEDFAESQEYRDAVAANRRKREELDAEARRAGLTFT